MEMGSCQGSLFGFEVMAVVCSADGDLVSALDHRHLDSHLLLTGFPVVSPAEASRPLGP